MKKKVVVLGGGTGMSYLLSGLKEFPLEITAVITVADNGRSTGKLREEFSTPAVGDIRKVLSKLSPLPPEIKNVMEYRFHTYSDLNGHPVGNLMLTAMMDQCGSLKKSIEYLSKLLDVKQTVLPLSEDYLTLVGETEEGKVITGQAEIMSAYQKYRKIYYKEKPHVLKEVLIAIEEADLIIFSMGSLYTSITPHLICPEIIKAIHKTTAKVMYLCNIMSQPGETSDIYVSKYLEHINQYLKDPIDVVIASNTEISEEMLKKYEEEEKDPIKIDYKKIKKMGIELIEDDLISLEDGTIKHNGFKLSCLIFSYLMR